MHLFKQITALSILSIGISTSVASQALGLPTKWSSAPVDFYLNPNAATLTSDVAEGAFIAALEQWSVDGTTFRYEFAGYSSEVTTGYDGRNVALFRAGADDATAARTYAWSVGGTVVDTDIVFSAPLLNVSTAAQSCSTLSDSQLLQGLAVHELGHAAGLPDTPGAAGTMSPEDPCSQSSGRLDSGALAALMALYPAPPQMTSSASGLPASTFAPVKTFTESKPSAGPTVITGQPTGTSPPTTTSAKTSGGVTTQTAEAPSAPQNARRQQSSTAPLQAAVASQQAAPLTQPFPAMPSAASWTTNGSSERGWAPSESLPLPTHEDSLPTRIPGSGFAAFGDGAVGADTPGFNPALGNAVPTVTISSPPAGSFPNGSIVSFAAAAVDPEDGKLTSTIVWTSSAIGQIGTGGRLSKALPSGSHLITATVTDSNGATAVQEVTITIVSSGTPLPLSAVLTASTARTQSATPVMTASAYTINRSPRVDLTWSGFATRSIKVFRDGVFVTATPNDGFWTDVPSRKSGSVHKYVMCTPAPAVCTSEVLVTF